MRTLWFKSYDLLQQLFTTLFILGREFHMDTLSRNQTSESPRHIPNNMVTTAQSKSDFWF